LASAFGLLMLMLDASKGWVPDLFDLVFTDSSILSIMEPESEVPFAFAFSLGDAGEATPIWLDFSGPRSLSLVPVSSGLSEGKESRL